MNKRIYWVDTAKGIGILLVIAGHCLQQHHGGLIFRTIYSFHMPLFFMIHGFLLKKDNIISRAKKNFHSMIIPYLCFSVFCLVKDYILGGVSDTNGLFHTVLLT